MDQRSFLSSLDPATRTALTDRQNAPGLRHLAAHLALIAALALWVGLRLPLWPVALLPLGVTLTFLFTLEHECTHQTPFHSPWLSTVAGHMSGLILILPFQRFRLFHLAHHRHTNDPDRDPELIGGQPITTRAQWVWHVTGLPVWRAQITGLIATALGRDAAPYLPTPAQPRLQAEARACLAVYAVVLASLTISPLALWLWIVPMGLGQPVLRLYLLAEHGDCPQVANMFVNTRTTFTTRMVRFLAWNMPYHAEHHIYPMVPFHRLAALHDLTRVHLAETEDGYARFTRKYLARRSPGQRNS